MAFYTNNNYIYLLMVVFTVVVWGSQSSDAFGTFGFDVHHRYSDPVKGILDLDGLPEKGSYDYYAAMAHRDRLIRGRRLADTVYSTPLIFFDSNETYRLSSLGFLHYANVSVGTPSLWFLVALDTGSDLFWLPCDCTSCVRSFSTTSGKFEFNIYSPNTSSTSNSVLCNSNFCQQEKQCSAASNACPYQVRYLSSNTSSTGFLVEDVLHLITDDSPLKAVDAPIKFGPNWEGGQYDGDEKSRLNVLQLAMELGADYIDMELQLEAAAVNLVAGEKPGDVYSEIASRLVYFDIPCRSHLPLTIQIQA